MKGRQSKTKGMEKSKNGRSAFTVFSDWVPGKRWTISMGKAREIAKAFKTGPSYTQISEKVGLSVPSLKVFRAEMIRAAAKGFKTIHKYYEAGRPCKQGKQELA